MARIFRIILWLFLILALIGIALAIWKREEITRLLAVNSLFSEDKIVSNFSNMNAAFLSTPVPAGNQVAALNPGPPMRLSADVLDWMRARSVTAMVVLHKGDIVHESYHLGTKPEDLRISWSVAKSYLSALMGVLVDEGTIASIDDPVVRYAPTLTDTAYGGATIRNVLNMSSGVTFNEDYLDQSSDINKMGRVLALGGSMDGFAEALSETFAAPGETMKYVSIDTHVLGMVIRGATGRSVPDLLSEKIIKPMGLEGEPYYLTDGFGVAFVLGGLNLMTRDYARMGQTFLQDGFYNGTQIVPADWVAASTVPSAPTPADYWNYGFQWWMAHDPRDGEFFARGVYGQYVYVDKTRDVVIAVNGADRGFREPGVGKGWTAMFRAIAAAAGENG